ncbi:Peptidase M23 [Desulfovibrio sp. X2]|uniref:M23 family metallopeptidase n=1 Tax=Desulfovibrio sp. X2 TaxID=941449 RepID=UPI000358C3E8|nr:M23 family metallopeptidase [Desulfovibrio sp. X2]EPR37526.1 Peptidase M23 [Desulfovibrio sp. X2]
MIISRCRLTGFSSFLCAFLLLLGTLCCAPSAARAQPVLEAPDRIGLGEPFLVSLVSRAPLEAVHVRWLGEEVPLDVRQARDGWLGEALLGTDVGKDTAGVQSIEVSGVEGTKAFSLRAQVSVVERDYPVEALTLPKKMVSPPSSVMARIEREHEAVHEALATMTRSRLWSLPLVRPVPGSTGSVYGLRRVLNGKPRSPHRGVDFHAPQGQSVDAVAAGRVVLVGEHYFAGRSVYVDHGEGVVSMYFHLSKVLVREGEVVDRGQAVGLVGATGRVTGPHLHFGLCLQGRCVDPLPLMEKASDTRQAAQ